MCLIISFGYSAAHAEEIRQPYNNECKPASSECTKGAYPEEDQEGPERKPEPKQEESIFSFLDTPQRTVSYGLRGFARSIDEFFADERVYYEATGSYISITADTVWEEAGKFGYTGDLRIKIRLPTTQKKLKLVFESDPDERKDTVEKDLQETPEQTVNEKAYFAGIQADLGKKDKWQFRPTIGIKIRSPLDLFFRFRASRTYYLNKWSLRLEETPYWFDSSGTGFDTLAELDRKISDDLLFRSSSFARWTDESDYFTMSQVFSLFQTLSERRAISYQAGVYGISEPTIFATDYLLAVRYRQNLHSDYLFLELNPQIRYRKDNDFHAEHSLTLRLELIFKG